MNPFLRLLLLAAVIAAGGCSSTTDSVAPAPAAVNGPAAPMGTAPAIPVVTAGSGLPTSFILVGPQRPATDAAKVKVYMIPPDAHFDEIAMVTAESDRGNTASLQLRTDQAMERLKSEAARLGANGVIIVQSGSRSGSATTQVSSISGKAIWTE